MWIAPKRQKIPVDGSHEQILCNNFLCSAYLKILYVTKFQKNLRATVYVADSQTSRVSTYILKSSILSRNISTQDFLVCAGFENNDINVRLILIFPVT